MSWADPYQSLEATYKNVLGAEVVVVVVVGEVVVIVGADVVVVGADVVGVGADVVVVIVVVGPSPPPGLVPGFHEAGRDAELDAENDGVLMGQS